MSIFTKYFKPQSLSPVVAKFMICTGIHYFTSMGSKCSKLSSSQLAPTMGRQRRLGSIPARMGRQRRLGSIPASPYNGSAEKPPPPPTQPNPTHYFPHPFNSVVANVICMSVLYILDCIVSLLPHPHAWVRLSALQLLGLLFASHSPDDLVSGLRDITGAESEGSGSRKRKRKGGAGSGGVVSEEESGCRHYLAVDTVNKVCPFLLLPPSLSLLYLLPLLPHSLSFLPPLPPSLLSFPSSPLLSPSSLPPSLPDSSVAIGTKPLSSLCDATEVSATEC